MGATAICHTGTSGQVDVMNKSCILSYCDVSKPVNGRSRRMFALLETLADSSLLFEPQHPHPLTDTRVYSPDFGKKKIGINWGIFNFYWPGTRRLVQKYIQRHPPPFILLTSIWDYHPVRSFSRIPMVLDAHNVDALAMAERFGQNHPFARRVRTREQEVASRMNHIFTCSEFDRQLFIGMYGVDDNNISVVPNGADIPQIASEAQGRILPETEDKLKDHTVLFFMGKLDYQPNREALDYLNTQIMPALDASKAGPFKLLVCGGPVPEGPYHPNIIFTGRVDTLPPYIQRSDICLAPLFSGSGTRFKIIEYLACSKPVISTPKGAEGLMCSSGDQLMLAEVDQFVPQIKALTKNSEAGRQLAQKGYQHVREHFDWQVIKPAWSSILLNY